MQLTDDVSLLERYVKNHSDEAFAELVAHHLNLVYSVALRQVNDPDQAQEVTQAVFIILAEKAGQLRHDKALSSWLFKTTRFTAANQVRSEGRRRQREQEAYMRSTLNEPPEEVWPSIGPLLDSAVESLNEKDRQAIVLRFYEARNLSEIGVVMGASEVAVQKRVSRALEKLRRIFIKRGVVLSAAAIATSMAANSVQAAPEGLAMTVAAETVKGVAVSSSPLTTIKGALKIMAWTKLKMAVGIGVGILLAGGVGTVVFQVSSDKARVQAIAKQSQEAYAALSSYSDSGGTTVTTAGEGVSTTAFSIQLQRPNLYRIEATNMGGSYSEIGAVWSDGSGDFLMRGAAGLEKTFQTSKMNDMQQALSFGASGSGNASLWIPGTFFRQNTGDALGIFATDRTQLKKGEDQKIGNVDCSVIISVSEPEKLDVVAKLGKYITKMGTMTTTLWIGKGDHLIHQLRMTTVGAIIPPMEQSDAVITRLLELQNKAVTPEAIVALRTERMEMMKKQGSDFIFTQTHENIVVNEKHVAADFSRKEGGR